MSGDALVARIKELVHEGSIRRVVKDEKGKTLIDLPLTTGVAGALVRPKLLAVGAIAAMVTHGKIIVAKVGD